MSDTVSSLVEQNITVLENAITGATGKWTGYGVQAEDLFDGNQSTQVLGAIQSMTTHIRDWEARGRTMAQTPAPAQADLDTWVSQGAGYVQDFNDVAGYASEANLVSIVADTVVATKTEVQTDVKAAATAVGGALTWWGTNGKTVMWGVAGCVALYVAWPFIKRVA